MCFLFPYLHIFGWPEHPCVPSAVARTILCFVPVGISSSPGSLSPPPGTSAFPIPCSEHHYLTAGLEGLSSGLRGRRGQILDEFLASESSAGSH